MANSDVKIFLADDHDVLRRGVRALLTAHPGWIVVGEANNGADAVKMVLGQRPDIVILDLEMPGINGVETTQQIKREAPGTQILIYTMHDAEWLIADALRAGARGYVLKSDDEQNLIAAVEALSNHKTFFSSVVSDSLMSHLRSFPRESEQKSALTSRELEIVHLLSDGKSNKDIASVLQLSAKTVESHRTRIMHKLGIKSIAALVLYAIRNKIISP